MSEWLWISYAAARFLSISSGENGWKLHRNHLLLNLNLNCLSLQYRCQLLEALKVAFLWKRSEIRFSQVISIQDPALLRILVSTITIPSLHKSIPNKETKLA